MSAMCVSHHKHILFLMQVLLSQTLLGTSQVVPSSLHFFHCFLTTSICPCKPTLMILQQVLQILTLLLHFINISSILIDTLQYFCLFVSLVLLISQSCLDVSLEVQQTLLQGLGGAVVTGDQTHDSTCAFLLAVAQAHQVLKLLLLLRLRLFNLGATYRMLFM